MKFSKAPDTDYLFSRYVSENNIVEVGIYPTLYGFRVHAGFVGEQYFRLDYCGGDNFPRIRYLFSATVSILSKREENKDCFKGLLTHSNPKPYYQDIEFVRFLITEAGIVDQLDVGNLTEYRNRAFHKAGLM